MKNYHRIKKKNRPLTPDEQAGMSNLLAGLKKLREMATAKQSHALGEAGRDAIHNKPIPR